MDKFIDCTLFPKQEIWFSLQHFAAEDEGRTEVPTESRIRKARKEGRVAKSADLTSAVVMMVTLAVLTLMSTFIIDVVSDMIRYFFTKVSVLSQDPMQRPDRADVAKLAGYFLGLALPVLGAVFAAAGITMLIQVGGFIFTTKPIIPDFKRIVPNFGRYLSRSVFGIEAFYNLGKSIMKVLLVVVMAVFTIQMGLPKLVTSPFTPLHISSKFLAQQALFLMFEATILFFVLAWIDFLFQKKQHLEQLKMTKQELRDEMREQEGNPQVKSRMRSRMLEFLRATMMRNVPKADVVITNPTHFAVALEYTKGARAPKVTAKGQDLVAQRIKEVAKAAGVPVIENKPLARALHANIEIGQEIPEEYWEIVSAIFVQVYRMTGKQIGI